MAKKSTYQLDKTIDGKTSIFHVFDEIDASHKVTLATHNMSIINLFDVAFNGVERSDVAWVASQLFGDMLKDDAHASHYEELFSDSMLDKVVSNVEWYHVIREFTNTANTNYVEYGKETLKKRTYTDGKNTVRVLGEYRGETGKKLVKGIRVVFESNDFEHDVNVATDSQGHIKLREYGLSSAYSTLFASVFASYALKLANDYRCKYGKRGVTCKLQLHPLAHGLANTGTPKTDA